MSGCNISTGATPPCNRATRRLASIRRCARRSRRSGIRRPQFRYLPQAVAGRYQLFFQDLAENDAYGVASRQYQFIKIDLAYQTNPRNAATVLAHEMQHARDFNAHGAIRNANECYAWEVRGFLTEAALWQIWYGQDGKPGATDPLESEENAILRQIRTDPEGFARSIAQIYTENGQCPQYPEGGDADRLLTTEGLPEGIAAAVAGDARLRRVARGARR